MGIEENTILLSLNLPLCCVIHYMISLHAAVQDPPALVLFEFTIVLCVYVRLCMSMYVFVHLCMSLYVYVRGGII